MPGLFVRVESTSMVSLVRHVAVDMLAVGMELAALIMHVVQELIQQVVHVLARLVARVRIAEARNVVVARTVQQERLHHRRAPLRVRPVPQELILGREQLHVPAVLGERGRQVAQLVARNALQEHHHLLSEQQARVHVLLARQEHTVRVREQEAAFNVRQVRFLLRVER